ncbi:hypothetical protein D9615_008855 [Tricholomella constricta]|uniref:ATP-dependent RNA helicase n=1 Tax=Tricholomella constricta TaxID=117010 RepID=A0A8H5GZV9_9AGAR|nr:hypothetical protein D9615_008855 [Tricholomella constricta]
MLAPYLVDPDHEFVSTLLEDEVNTHVHGTYAFSFSRPNAHIFFSLPQTHIIAPFASTLPLVLHILRQERLTHALPTDTTSISKTIVFFPTARHVSFAYQLLFTLPGLPPVLELHSRKSQDARTKASARFRDATEAVLLSSDVAARGMDFPGYAPFLSLSLIPCECTVLWFLKLWDASHAILGGIAVITIQCAINKILIAAFLSREFKHDETNHAWGSAGRWRAGVTLVLQLNLPASTEQYIHRLRRTARADAGGRGILVLDPTEQRFLALKDVHPLGIALDPQFAQFMFPPAALEYAEVRDATTRKARASVACHA